MTGVVWWPPVESIRPKSCAEPRDALASGEAVLWEDRSGTSGGAPRHRYHPVMAEWIYFIHPPRDDFAATMTDEENAVWAEHFVRFQRLLREGVIVLVGPTLGRFNTGIAILEAPDEATARRVMEDDPVIAGGYARGELRPFRVSLMRGRDT